MPSQEVAQNLEIDGLFLEELGNPNQVLRPAHPQRRCHEVLRAQNARPDGIFDLPELDFHLFRPSKRLCIQGAGHRQELDRPTLDHDSLLAMLFVSPGLQVRIDRSERDEARRRLIGGAIEGNQDVEIIRNRRLDVVVGGNSAADRISAR
jgi:hypothetical protein